MKKYIEIRPASGGTEAEIFSDELAKIYFKYCNKNKIDVALTTSNSRTFSFIIEGNKDKLKVFNNEIGVHKIQRVPSTEKRGRVHTSTVTVAILDLNEEEDKNKYFNKKDIKIDIYKSSGAGGQHRNKVETAIRVTHIPTGIVVISANERSQLTNKKMALEILNSKLKYLEQKQKNTKIENVRAGQIKNGAREEARRIYNFQRNEVNDLLLNQKKSLKNFYKGELFN